MISEEKKSLESDNSNFVLLVIDAQGDFLSNEAPYKCVNSKQTIMNIADVLEKAREKEAPIVFTREAHLDNGSDYGMEMEIGEPPHCVIGTKGFEIVSDLTPRPNEIVIDKKRYDAFLGTPLDLYLRQYESPTIYISGFATNVCIHYTAITAFQYDYRIRILRDCVSATSKEKHELGLRMLEFLSPELISSKRKFFIAIE